MEYIFYRLISTNVPDSQWLAQTDVILQKSPGRI